MNEPKSSRYHRLARRAGFVSLALTAGLLLATAWMRPELPLTLYVVVLETLHEVITLPVVYYRSFLLEHRYELSSEPRTAWLRDHLKAFGLVLVFAVAGAHVVYRLIAWSAEWWWLAAALAGAGVTVLLARAAPVLLLPLFYRFTPLERPELSARLLELSRRAGVPVLGVFEWGLGEKTRRANAALVGSGRTRRILLSDTLLAAGFVAAQALKVLGGPIGLHGPADPAGLPVALLGAGAVMLAATPIVHALSRVNERRADAFAIALTGQNDAFVSAMRRLGSQNLAEESPSRASVLLFHSHPPIEERIAAALR